MSLSVAIFSHSLLSDWNHGNAHFLRGIAADLQDRGHTVTVFEPEDSWSRKNLEADHGSKAVADFQQAFPKLRSRIYSQFYFDEWLGDTDLVLVHEWNEPALVEAIGRYRKTHRHLRLFFHDTHHRAITSPDELARFDLSAFDGVLVYGESLKRAYERLGWGKQVHVWHEAADVRIFHPIPAQETRGDLVWIGNWGDDERTSELREFFIEPCRGLALRAEAYGVRYPAAACQELAAAGIEYRGWLPNYKAPKVFGKFAVTIHVPRRPYAQQLTGIPTIRPFEALACGIPLVSAPWRDDEGLFRAGVDFLMVNNGHQMLEQLRNVLNDSGLAQSLARNGLETILARHTCAHRVTELLTIYETCAAAAETSQEVYR